MTVPLDGARAAAGEALAELGIPGCALWAVHAGEEAGFGLGVASVVTGVPFTPDTIVQAGSITKTLTATAAVRLAQAGRLELDAPVRDVLPGLRLADEGVAAIVTMRDLLQHAGGFLGDAFDDLGWGDDALARFVDGFDRLPQVAPPRTVWSYCNTGFSIAGRALEAVTGTPYEEVARELALPEALFFPWDAITRPVAVGHLSGAAGPVVAEPWAVSRTAAPAGGLLASVRTLVHYGRLHLEDPSLAPMQEAALDVAEDTWMGLAWFLRELGGVRVVEHGGTTNGQCAWLLLVPERATVLAVATNHQHGHALHRRVLRRALEDLLGLASPEPQPIEVSAGTLAEAAGRYEAALSDVLLRVEGDRLLLELVPKGGFPRPDSPPVPAPPPAPVAFHAADALHVADGVLAGSRGQFLRDPAGRVEWLRFGLRAHRRAD